MANSIMQQASDLASDGGNRINQRSSLAETERLQQEASNAATLAQAKQQKYQAVSQYQSSGAEQEKIQGQNLMQQGAAKQAIGGGLTGMGAAMVAAGFAVSAATAGAGATLIGQGMTMIGQGLTQIVMGGVDQGQGKQALARFQEKLDLATKNDVLSKEENKIVTKEMRRSQVYEMKKQLLNDLMSVMQPMLDKMGEDGKDMTEDQMTKWFDKMMEDGAKTMANGGLLETDLKDTDGKAMFTDENGNAMEGGNFYFMQDKETGSIFQLEVARDSDGNALTGALGEPLLNLDGGAKEVEDGQLKEYLKNIFMFADKAKNMAMQVGLDPNDSAQANEFADLVTKTNLTDIKDGKIPAPLKVIYEGNKVYLQEWDYENDVPIGPKTPADDLAGGEYDRGDIESYQLALERSDAAMQALGFAGGTRFNLLNSTANFGISAETSDAGGFGDISSRDSSAFANFGSVSTTLDIAKAQKDILSSSTADNTGNRA